MNFATLLYWSYCLLLQELWILAVVPLHCITFTALSNPRHLPSFNNGSFQHSWNQWRISWQTIRMACLRSTSIGSNSSRWAIHQEEYPRRSARTFLQHACWTQIPGWVYWTQTPPVLLQEETWTQEDLRRSMVHHQRYRREILVLCSSCWT